MRKCKEVNCSRFGDEFRPVRLDLHVIGYDSTDNPNDAFKFDNNLNYRWVITIEYFLSSRILNALSGSSMSSRDTIQKRNQLLSFAVQGREPHKQVWAVMTKLFLHLTFFFEAKILCEQAAAHQSFLRDSQHRTILSQISSQLQEAALKG